MSASGGLSLQVKQHHANSQRRCFALKGTNLKGMNRKCIKRKINVYVMFLNPSSLPLVLVEMMQFQFAATVAFSLGPVVCDIGTSSGNISL